jgi:hypothetical protein
MDNLYVEPCPGCLENRLLELSGRAGNPVFLSPGDLTLRRLVVALAKLTQPHPKVFLVSFRFFGQTYDFLSEMIGQEMIGEADVFTCQPEGVKFGDSNIRVFRTGTYVQMVALRSEVRTLMVAGPFQQVAPSYATELYTMVTNGDEQKRLLRALCEGPLRRGERLF